MGWSSECTPSRNKKEFVEAEIRGFKESGYEVVKYKSTAQGLYAVMISPKKEKFLMCALIEKHEGLFGIKTMEENMGPSMNDCPVSFFELMGPTENEYANSFRESCRAREAKKKWAPTEGEKVRVNGEEYIVGEKYNKISYLITCCKTGNRYKTPKKNMEVING